jgi:polyhydroxybutyrate depolymerase
MQKALVIFALLLLASCAGESDGGLILAGTHDFSMMHDDEDRRYYVHIPKSYNAGVLHAVVLNFHGGGGTAKDGMTETKLNETADKYGFIAVHPEGTGISFLGRKLATWNAGECCAHAMENDIDDVGFVSTLLDRLEETYAIDPKRIYATGHSNGALFSYRLACELSDKIAAIAPNGSHDGFKNCEPTRPVPVIHFHGTADPAAPYDGGTCGGLFAKALGLPVTEKETWECAPVPEYIESWASANGCNLTPQTTLEQGASRCVTYSRCKNGADVSLCTLVGGGHTWPGGAYASNLQYYHDTVGPISSDISANEEMWKFFEAHPLR